MLQTANLLFPTSFPDIRRARLTTLQVNLGLVCNQSCTHCHVNAGPSRTEMMSAETVQQVVQLLQQGTFEVLDLTGGAPEMNVHFTDLVEQARKLGLRVIDRCNLTILQQPGYEPLAAFLAQQQVEIVASLPCYLQENVDKQRGKGVFQQSIASLRQLNELGYGQPDSDLQLNLVFNPQDASLPPAQLALEKSYKDYLWSKFSIRFNHLLSLTNMPIQRFGSMLQSKNQCNYSA
ncbi:MAG: arsenosugar biosynthesis radical SAM protein ArsS [gamma proteobacterium symbiont of Bathyaustriella thionipta]|nr:arsenosugar biosynthesis radical SAM protein ArsS [gamma proteobacterium symbiont of Bathyaustriella thionipta]